MVILIGFETQMWNIFEDVTSVLNIIDSVI